MLLFIKLGTSQCNNEFSKDLFEELVWYIPGEIFNEIPK